MNIFRVKVKKNVGCTKVLSIIHVYFEIFICNAYRIFAYMNVNAGLISFFFSLLFLLNACAGAKTDASIVMQEKIDSAVMSTVAILKMNSNALMIV